MLRIAMDSGADIEAKDSQRNSALMLLASGGHADGLAMLIDAKANVAASGGYCASAAMLAANNGHEDCLSLLIAAGADMSSKSTFGFLPRLRNRAKIT